MKLDRSICCAAIAVLAGPAVAQDHATIDKSDIIGNRELPKVLYIVPWKKPLPGDLTGRPMQSVLDEAMAPLDKDVVQRELRYQSQALEQKDRQSRAGPGAPQQAGAAQNAAPDTTRK